jgi:hypothetical protein
MRVATRIFLVLLLAAIASACATRARSIADLKYDPGRYHDRTVNVQGVVTSSWGVPLVPVKLYKIEDGTGELTVLSRRGHVPARGAHVRVTGRVSELAMFGGNSIGLHVQEEKRSVLRR